jgi:hypothetical protein
MNSNFKMHTVLIYATRTTILMYELKLNHINSYRGIKSY